MTSNEALELIVRKHCISNTDEEDEELEKCYKCVMSDLEVLEILKKHLRVERDNIGDSDDFEEILSFTKGIKYQDYAFCNFSMKPEGDYQKSQADEFNKVKEWLERKGNKNDL